MVKNCLVYVAIVVGLYVANIALASDPLRISVNAVGKPYHYIDDEGRTQGLLRDIFDTVTNHMAIDVEYSSNLYTRGVILQNKGDIDVLTVFTIPNEITDQPQKAFRTPQPISKVPMVLYALASRNITIDRWEQLKRYKVGIIRFNRERTSAEKNYVVYPRNEYSLKALADGDIDIAMSVPGFTRYWGERFGVEFEAVLPVTLINSYWSFSTSGLGDEAAEICSQFYLAYQQLAYDGSLNEVYERNKLTELIPYFVLKPETPPTRKACVPVDTKL